MKFKLTLTDSQGQEVASRNFDWTFDGIGKDLPGKLSSHEEYAAALKIKELYRDAAYSVGKWPTRGVGEESR